MPARQRRHQPQRHAPTQDTQRADAAPEQELSEEMGPEQALMAQGLMGNAGVASMIGPQAGGEDDEGHGSGESGLALGSFAWLGLDEGLLGPASDSPGATGLASEAPANDGAPAAERGASSADGPSTAPGAAPTGPSAEGAEAEQEASVDLESGEGGHTTEEPGGADGAAPGGAPSAGGGAGAGDASGGGGASGAGGGAPTETASASPAALNTEDPGALLQSVADAPPSQLAPTYDAARSEGPAVLQAQRDEVSESLPELQTPTGIAPSDAEAPQIDDAVPDAKAEVQLPEGEGPEAQPDVGEAPEAPPAQQQATQISGSEREGQGDEQVAASATDALASVSLPTAAVPTVDPNKPSVALTGGADPKRMDGAKQSAEAEVARARQQALAQSKQDFGEGDVAPASDPELLSASSALSAPAAINAPEAGEGAIPTQMLADVDAQAGPVLDGRIQEGLTKYEQGQAKFDVDSQAARDKADGDISSAESDAVQTQTSARNSAQTEVGQARTDWQTKIEEVKSQASGEAEAARTKQLKAIQGKKTEADAKARKHIQDGERKAEAKKRDANRKAEAKKRAAEKESQGFWGWVKSKARALIDGLKAAVNAIYEGLRAAVKAIFELAKTLAVGVIELAQKAIVGLIKLYGELLKGIIKVALAAFPKLAAEINKRIDAAVKKATDLVNKAAELLKKAVSAILDFLASTLDKLLSLVQSLYNAAFTLIGMIVSGEWKEILAGLKNLVTAAGEAPLQFEAAAYEELLGGDMNQPLSAAELQLAGITPKAPAGGDGDAAAAQMAGGEEDVQLPGPPWTPENVGVDQVVSDMELGPELSAQILEQTGGDGEIEFGQSEDPSRSMEGILGVDAAQMKGASAGAQIVPDDGLTVGERAAAKWTIMKKGLADWWSKNWPLVLAGGVIGVGGFIAANVLTGGAVMAALPAVMSALGPLFMGMLAAQVGGYVGDYLSKGWGGDTKPAGKSLAKALAVGAIELISALTFKAGGAALKGAKAVAKGVAKGAKAAAKGAMKLLRKGANYVLKNGKVLLKGLGNSAFGKGFKRVGDLGKGLLKRTKFKGFRIKIKSRRFVLEGKINPWVKVAEGRIVDADAKTKGAFEVDNKTYQQIMGDDRINRGLAKSKSRPSADDLATKKSAKDQRRQKHQDAQQKKTQQNEELIDRAEGKLNGTDKGTGKPRETHGKTDHGHQTGQPAQEHRLKTSETPSGRKSLPKDGNAGWFANPDAQAEALRKGWGDLQDAIKQGKVRPEVGPDGRAATWVSEVTTKRVEGFGNVVQAKPNPSGGGFIKNNQGGYVLSGNAPKVTKQAVVVWEWVADAGTWKPLTYYPKG